MRSRRPTEKLGWSVTSDHKGGGLVGEYGEGRGDLVVFLDARITRRPLCMEESCLLSTRGYARGLYALSQSCLFASPEAPL
jgi:hypothetical protein